MFHAHEYESSVVVLVDEFVESVLLSVEVSLVLVEFVEFVVFVCVAGVPVSEVTVPLISSPSGALIA